MALRMQDAQNGYLVILIPQGAKGGTHGLYLLKRVNGSENTLAASRGSLPGTGQWATLAVEAGGNRIQVSLKGKRLIDHSDAAAPGFAAGKIGLRIYGLAEAPCHASFRNARVQ